MTDHEHHQPETGKHAICDHCYNIGYDAGLDGTATTRYEKRNFILGILETSALIALVVAIVILDILIATRWKV